MSEEKVTFRLPAELRARVQAVARAQLTTESTILRQAVLRGLRTA